VIIKILLSQENATEPGRELNYLGIYFNFDLLEMNSSLRNKAFAW
jgi:hypothetical protein